VTIVEVGDRLLPAEEPQASEAVQATFEGEGIAIYTSSLARQVAAGNGQITVTLSSGEAIAAERLLVATGRKVDLSGLGLEAAGLDSSARAIPVDERLRAADGIWAMGDVTGVAMFTHIALYQSAVIAADILGLDHPPARYDTVPRVTFTDPEVGSVGMTEAQAREAGIDVIVVVKQLPASFRGWLHGSQLGVIKLVADRRTGLLVGATTAGPRGGDMLGLLALAMHARVPLAELQSMIYAFPTFYGAIGEAIGAYGRGLSTVIDPPYRDFELLDAIEEAG